MWGSLLSGNRDGTISGMENRATKAIADDVLPKLSTVLAHLARIDSKLASKPDQGWIINAVCIILGGDCRNGGLFAAMR